TKKLAWEGNRPDNHFRGLIEIRYVPSTERLWAINELPIEDYLRGLTETNDDAPSEFHKAQVIAARTFALYHIETGGKYTKGQFVLTGTASDQVYRGEDAAARRPNLVHAVEETRGVVMTYDSSVVITPYYAQSNGQTLAFSAVWGGKPKAWLVPVADPVCDGKRMIGHGVGMPQRCAMTLANQGWTFGAILKNYYQGVELRKIYE
ncbi:MAG: SpoIID/LytB domain-containing protein, partial [bacterium]|nr:SpoIID/LytB domain-containing protein [bacterium]